MNTMKLWPECTLEEKIERWQNVVRVLEALTAQQREAEFNMHKWGEKTVCGTTACIAGHCGFDAWFRERGFTLDFEENFRGRGVRPVISNTDDFFGWDADMTVFLDTDNIETVEDAIEAVKLYITNIPARHERSRFA